MRQTLPGIRRIFYTTCPLLPPAVQRRAMAGMPVQLLHPIERIAFFGNPELSVDEEDDNGAVLQKARLYFRHSQRLPTEARLAFVVALASGRTVLIGHREPPFPLVTAGLFVGMDDATANGTDCTVVFHAPRALVDVVL